MNFQEDSIGIMGRKSKPFKQPCSVIFQAKDFYGTDIDEILISIIKLKIHDLDDDITEAIKSSHNALKLWTIFANMFEFSLFGDVDDNLIGSKSILNTDHSLIIDRAIVYDTYLDDVLIDVVFNMNETDDKEMLWYIYRYFESTIISIRLEILNGAGKDTPYFSSFNHTSKLLNRMVLKLQSVFVVIMSRFGPDEEFDKKLAAYFAGKVSEDDLEDMCIPIEANVIKGMSDEYIFPFNENLYLGGLDDWKKMLGKYGKYNKALHDYYMLCNRKEGK